MKRKYILIVIAILLAAGAWYGYSEYTRTNADLSNEKPEVVIDAVSLIAAFEKDSAAANKQFLDKIVLVTGTIKSIDTSGVISLGAADQMSSVQCTMDSRQQVNYTNLIEDQSIKIQGKCTGYQTDELLGTDVKLNFSVIK